VTQPPPPPPPYGAPGGGYGYQPTQKQATVALILGILGVVICGVLAPVAMIMGRNSMKEIDASGGQLGGRGRALAGFVLGIIGTVFLAIGIIYLIAVVST
jgi:Domain of unknown function (DUF4190)